MSDSAREKAEAFRALHHGDHLLILPNAWDVPSARLFEEAGFPAVATSSATLAASLGYADGERIPRGEFLAVVRRMASSLQVPLSVDAESGYGETPKELAGTIRGIVRAGAVGLNLEDTSRVAGRDLRPVEEQVQRLVTVRKTADAIQVPVVINARTDAFTVGSGNPAARLAETIRRARAYEAAAPDCLYPMGLADAGSIDAFVRAVKHPVNVMVRKGLPPVAELERLGVKRLSLGPSSMYAALGALKVAARELRERGTYDALTTGAVTFDELMALAGPRRT